MYVECVTCNDADFQFPVLINKWHYVPVNGAEVIPEPVS